MPSKPDSFAAAFVSPPAVAQDRPQQSALANSQRQAILDLADCQGGETPLAPDRELKERRVADGDSQRQPAKGD